MFRPIILVSALVLAAVAHADEPRLSDLRAQNAVQLSAADLRQLMPGAKVKSVHDNGSAPNWKNNPDGKFMASSDVRGKLKTLSQASPGTWRVDDAGTYCVTIEWPKLTEDWCKYIFKVNGKYFGVNSLTKPNVKALEFEFSQ
jgi:hypothetical protein